MKSYPLNDIQTGILFGSSNNSDEKHTYLNQVTISFQEKIDEKRLRQAIKLTLECYPILNAFVDPSKLEIIINDSNPLDYTAINIDPVYPSNAIELINRHKNAELQRGIDIEKPPLIRFLLMRVAEKDFRLLITYHHILMAGRSVLGMLQQFIAFYDGDISNTKSLVYRPALNSVIDNITKKVDLSEVEKYYKQQMQIVGKNSPIGIFKHGTKSIPKTLAKSLNESLSHQIKRYCKERGITNSMFFNMAWSILQNWYLQSNHSLFGITKELPYDDTNGTYGFSINILPIIIQFNQDTSISSIIRDLRKQSKLSKKSVFYPLKKIRDLTNIPNDAPLLNTVIDYKPYSINEFMKKTMAQWEKKGRHVEIEFYTDYPLFLEVFNDNGSFVYKLTYQSGYDEPVIIEISNLLVEIIRLLINFNDASTISELYNAILANKKSKFFITGTYSLSHNPSSIIKMILNKSSHLNHKPAIVYDGIEINFKQLGILINRIEERLSKQYSLEEGHTVFIEASRHILYLPAILSLIKLKVTFVPINEEGELLYDDKLNLINPNLIIRLKNDIPKIDNLIDKPPLLIEERHLKMNKEINSDIAYVLFTSGTTGKPKGVKVKYSAIDNIIESFQVALKVEASDKFLSISNFTFDISYLELLMPIACGATCFIATASQKLNPGQLKKLIIDNQITIIQGTPSFFSSYLRSDSLPYCIQQIICGGEALTISLAKQLLLPNARLWNAYGPTETTIWSTIKEVSPNDFGHELISIGKPIKNTIIGIKGKNHTWLPKYAVGEICIGGLGLFDGYVGRPKNSQKNIAYYSDQTSFYKTGDMGYIDQNGLLYFIGRNDDQIKIHGHRIELNHIEHVLTSIDGISKVVVGCYQQNDAPYLVAFYSLDKSLNEKNLKKIACKLLPYYMRPTFYVKMNTFPLTSSGKIDKRQLKPPPILSITTEAFPADAAFIEDQWSKVLNVSKTNISMESHFFMLGGNSIDVIKLVNRVNDFYDIDLTIKDLFENPTLKEFYSLSIQKTAISNNRTPSNSVIKKTNKKHCPLSLQQERIWSFQQIQKKSSMYNMFICFELHGILEPDILKTAFLYLIKKHSILRTTYAVIDGKPIQVIHGINDFLDEVFTYYNCNSSNEAEALAKEFSNYHFNLKKEIPIKIGLVFSDENTNFLFVNIHHIACDGWSMLLLLNDLNSYFKKARLTGIELSTKEKLSEIIEYKDYALWQKSRNNDCANKKYQNNFWKKYLSLTQPVLLPQKKENASAKKGKRINFSIDDIVSERIKDIANRKKSTPFLILISSFAALMHRYTLQDNFFITIPVSGRKHPQLEEVVGFFVNLLPLTFKVNEKTTLNNLCKSTKKNLFNIIQHQDVPFNLIQKQLPPTVHRRNDMNHHALLNLLFVMQDDVNQTLQIPSVSAKRTFSDNETLLLSDFDSAKFDMTIFLQQKGSCINGLIEYNQELYSDDFIQTLITNYLQFLTNVVQSMSVPIQSISFHQNAIAINHQASPANLLPSINIVMQWNTCCEKFGQDVFIKNHEKSLTFNELDRLANQLKSKIISKATGSNLIIALYLENKIDFIIASIATLKANHSYLPLDTAWPTNRITTILKDAMPSLVITDNVKFSKEMNYNTLLLPDANNGTYHLDREVIELENNLAYIIYTSGTTSMPKGVCVSHHNLSTLLQSTKQLFGFHYHDTWCLLHSTAFDFSVWEIWGAIFNGAKLCVPEKNIGFKPKKLIDFLLRNKVTVLNLTPGVFELILNEISNDIHSMKLLGKQLRCIILGGDSIENVDISLWFNLSISNDVELFNLYGITEATIHTTFHRVTKDDILSANQSNIGKSLPHTNIYVVDKNNNIVPNHIVGELLIKGPNVSQGYLSAYDDDSFIKLSEKTEIKDIFRTGDLVRRWGNNDLEYIGRRDSQINRHGYRISLKEITFTMKQHEAISQAYAVMRKIQNQQQLYLYLIFNSQSLHQEQSAIKLWQRVYDKFYSVLPNSASINIEGWLCSYTEKPYSLPIMQEWLQLTVNRLKFCQSSDVIEIGCGTGMIIEQVMPLVSSYSATDISKNTIQHIRTKLADDEKAKTFLFNQAADKTDIFQKNSCDLLICNSVIQYFPNTNYFLNCINNWLPLMRANSTIFLGDIRSLEHQKQFYRKVAYKRNIEKYQLDDFVKKRSSSEEELLVHHDLFRNLTHISKRINFIKIELKYSSFESEMSDFRYDVTLGIERPKPKHILNLKWESFDNSTIDIKLESLSKKYDKYVAIKNIPNAAYANPYKKAKPIIGINELATKAEKYQLKVLVQFSNEMPDSCVDIIFFHQAFISEIETTCFLSEFEHKNNNDLRQYFNTPKNMNNAFLFKSVMNYMRNNLPSYMYPNKIFYLNNCPMTKNGKIDYNYMLQHGKPILEHVDANLNGNFSKTEEKIASLWSTLFHSNIHDKHTDFFQIGGNSLQAIEMISEVEQFYDIDIPIKKFYNSSSIVSFSKLVDSLILSSELNKSDIFYQVLDNTPFIVLKSGNSATPLFLFPPIGGSVFPYLDLVKYLHCHQTVYAAQDPAIEEPYFLDRTIEELVAFYLKHIKKIQPRGPYFFAGSSLGGTLAYEAAFQIKYANSEEKVFVAMFDSWALYSKKLAEKERLKKGLMRQYELIKSRLNKVPLKNPNVWLNLHYARLEQVSQYKPPKFLQDINLYKSKLLKPEFREIDEKYNHWKSYANGNIDVVFISGDHETIMLKDNVKHIAASLNKKISVFNEHIKQILDKYNESA